jgi:hypothetical protein
VKSGVRGQRAHRLRRTGRGLDGVLGIGLPALRNLSEDFPGEGIVHRSACVTLAPVAANKEWTWSLQKDTPLGRSAYVEDSTEDADAGSTFAACSEALALATKSSVPQSAMASIANAS